jgi:hypothetical protein
MSIKSAEQAAAQRQRGQQDHSAAKNVRRGQDAVGGLPSLRMRDPLNPSNNQTGLSVLHHTDRSDIVNAC